MTDGARVRRVYLLQLFLRKGSEDGLELGADRVALLVGEVALNTEIRSLLEKGTSRFPVVRLAYVGEEVGSVVEAGSRGVRPPCSDADLRERLCRDVRLDGRVVVIRLLRLCGLLRLHLCELRRGVEGEPNGGEEAGTCDQERGLL